MEIFSVVYSTITYLVLYSMITSIVPESAMNTGVFHQQKCGQKFAYGMCFSVHLQDKEGFLSFNKRNRSSPTVVQSFTMALVSLAYKKDFHSGSGKGQEGVVWGLTQRNKHVGILFWITQN